jgi:hypothetical protein
METRRKKNDVFQAKHVINAHRFKLVEMLKNETKRKKNPKKTNKNAFFLRFNHQMRFLRVKNVVLFSPGN